MKIWLTILVTFLLPALAFAKIQVYTKFDSLIYTPSQPYQNFESNWTSPYQKASHALQHNWMEIGVKYNHWGISFLRQDFAEMRFSPDSGRFYWLTDNRQSLEMNYSYEIDIEVHHASMQGLRIFYENHLFTNLKMQFGISLLQGKRLFVGRLQGRISPLASNDYEYDNIQVDYFYSKDILFDREIDAPKGNGASLDWQLLWQRNRKTHLLLEVRNLYGFIDWKQTPHTVAKVTSDNKEYDENGYVIVHAMLEGQHYIRDYHQKLLPMVKFRSLYQFADQYSLLFELLYNKYNNFPALGFTRFSGSSSQVEIFYILNAEALGLRYENKWGHLGISSDNVIPEKSRYFSINLQLKI